MSEAKAAAEARRWVEDRLSSARVRYMASCGAISGREIDGIDPPGAFRVDARDLLYTALDLAGEGDA